MNLEILVASNVRISYVRFYNHKVFFGFLNSGIIRHAWLFKIIFVHISQGCFGCVKLGFSQFKFLVDDTMKNKLYTLLLAFSIDNN